MSRITNGFYIKDTSTITGEPIVGIVSNILNASKNVKTGNMAMLWILSDLAEPHKAVKTGSDSAVCGECPMRHNTGGACYVLPHHAPLSVYKAYKRGKYLEPNARTLEYLKGIPLRFGAYGDPLALSRPVLERLLVNRSTHTAYSYQWREPDNQWARPYIMASVHNNKDYEQAKDMGWSTFRVKRSSESIPGTVQCLNETIARQCKDCTLCSGYSDAGKQRHITVNVHGARLKRFGV